MSTNSLLALSAALLLGASAVAAPYVSASHEATS
jgi:hypothetical protein